MKKDLGVGVVYSPGLEPLLEAGTELVAVAEVEPQTLWLETQEAAEPYRIDPDAVARLRPLPQIKVVHGVGFPVGGSRPPDTRNLAPLRTMIEELESPWASEHLSFNRTAGPRGDFSTGFLLPPRQTREGVDAAVATIRGVARELPVPFAVETGVNYLRPRDDELSDGAFVAAVAEGADCGILLDLHNIWANERNGRQSVAEFVAELPAERVWEVHIAGGFELDGYWLDAHSGDVAEPLLELAESLLPSLPALRVITFELLPDYIPQLGLERVRAQLEALNRLWERRAGADGRRSLPPRPGGRRVPAGPSPEEWEDVLGGLVIGEHRDGPLARELAADPGLAILRKLVSEFRAGTIVGTLQLTSRLLLLSIGEQGFRALLADFWRERPPELFAATEAENCAAFLEALRPQVPYLEDVLAFERAVLHARANGEASTVRFAHDPSELVEALTAGQLPRSPRRGDFEITIAA